MYLFLVRAVQILQIKYNKVRYTRRSTRDKMVNSTNEKTSSLVVAMKATAMVRVFNPATNKEKLLVFTVAFTKSQKMSLSPVKTQFPVINE